MLELDCIFGLGQEHVVGRVLVDRVDLAQRQQDVLALLVVAVRHVKALLSLVPLEIMLMVHLLAQHSLDVLLLILLLDFLQHRLLRRFLGAEVGGVRLLVLFVLLHVALGL